jgi:hypothetical protein
MMPNFVEALIADLSSEKRFVVQLIVLGMVRKEHYEGFVVHVGYSGTDDAEIETAVHLMPEQI